MEKRCDADFHGSNLGPLVLRGSTCYLCVQLKSDSYSKKQINREGTEDLQLGNLIWRRAESSVINGSLGFRRAPLAGTVIVALGHHGEVRQASEELGIHLFWWKGYGERRPVQIRQRLGRREEEDDC